LKNIYAKRVSLRDGWSEVALGDIASFRSGKFLPKHDRLDDGAHPVYGANGEIGRTNRVLVSPPVITVGRVGACGEVQLVTEPAWVSDNALIVEPRGGVRFHFLELLLKLVDYTAIRSGSTQPLITQRALSAVTSTLPPLDEQRRIESVVAAISSALSAARQVRDAGLALRSLATDALLSKATALPDVREVTLATVIHRVRRPVKVIPDRQYEQIGIRSFGRGFFEKQAVTGAELGNKKIFEIHGGDLVFNIVFAWEGAVALAGEKEHLKVASHRFPTHEIDDNFCDARYLLNFFKSAAGVHLLGLNSPGSAGRNRTLNQDGLLGETILLPPLDVQTRLANLFDAFERSNEAARARAAALEDLRTSISTLLLSGQHRIPESYEDLLEAEDEHLLATVTV
jgi:restriction endonuclease S subunit